jgi:hypothetical protein
VSGIYLVDVPKNYDLIRSSVEATQKQALLVLAARKMGHRATASTQDSEHYLHHYQMPENDTAAEEAVENIFFEPYQFTVARQIQPQLNEIDVAQVATGKCYRDSLRTTGILTIPLDKRYPPEIEIFEPNETLED